MMMMMIIKSAVSYFHLQNGTCCVCFETYVSGYWQPLVLKKILTFCIVCIVSTTAGV